jgi:NO-binding membrane sensor protein with MHYT domain
MRWLWNILGLMLLALACYFVTQNIVWTYQITPQWWGPVVSNVAVFTIATGLALLCTLGPKTRLLGWLVLGIGIGLMFFTGLLAFQLKNWGDVVSAVISLGGGSWLLRLGKFSL